MNSLQRPGVNPVFENSFVEVLVVAAFGVFYFSYALTYFDHNDFLYSASAHSPGKLYRDVHYNQAPLGFYFWRVVASVSPEGFSYPIFRLVSAALGFFGI